jgi:hypothetical protein
MTHLQRDELIRWRDQGLADDRARVLSHLASCKACAESLAELIRTAPLTDTPQHFNPADFVERGYAARRSTARHSWSAALTSWKLWAGAFSAAAILLVALVGVLVVTRQARPGFETLSDRSTDTGGARLTVAFDPNATEGTIREALLEVHGAIVSGPSATGIYVVKLATPENDETATNAAIGHLRSRSGIVRFVERQP